MAQNNEAIIFENDGVFIHTTVAQADEDALVAGKIFMKNCKEGLFIEWKPLDEVEESKRESSEWTVIDKVSFKQDLGGSVTMNPVMKRHKYIINFDIRDLKSFKRSRPKLGWSYLIFILKDGTTYPALHFHKGGTKNFVKAMEQHLLIKKCVIFNFGGDKVGDREFSIHAVHIYLEMTTVRKEMSKGS